MDEISADPNLSPTGKADACRKIAERAVAEAKASSALDEARVAVERQMQKWDAKIAEAIKPAADVHTAMIYGKILDRVASMPREARLTFFQEHSDDLQVASALLTAPSFLSNLTEAEIAMVRSRLERSVLSAEVIEAKDATTKAMASAEKGWARAVDVIAQRGGLQPSKAKAA
jgi:hypothetical protein